jgi:hypothetical protein
MSSFFLNIENEAIYYSVYIIEFNKALINEIIKNNKTPSTKLSHNKHNHNNENGKHSLGSHGKNSKNGKHEHNDSSSLHKHHCNSNRSVLHTDHRHHNNPPKKMEDEEESPKYIGNNDISMKTISNPFTD